MMGVVIFVHVVASILLVITILMQAGRGGGLTEAFASAENILGAHTSAVLVKTTSILAAVFITTSLTLAFLSTKKDQSLMATVPAGAQTKSPVEVKGPAEIQTQVEKSLDAVEKTAAEVLPEASTAVGAE